MKVYNSFGKAPKKTKSTEYSKSNIPYVLKSLKVSFSLLYFLLQIAVEREIGARPVIHHLSAHASHLTNRCVEFSIIISHPI